MAKILVVDDDSMNLKMADRVLKMGGHEAVTVSSGAEAVDVLDSTIELVLLDIEMPVMNGFETLAAMKESGKLNVPVLFLTADTEDETKQKAVSAGALGLVGKPFKKDILLDAVSGALA